MHLVVVAVGARGVHMDGRVVGSVVRCIPFQHVRVSAPSGDNLNVVAAGGIVYVEGAAAEDATEPKNSTRAAHKETAGAAFGEDPAVDGDGAAEEAVIAAVVPAVVAALIAPVVAASLRRTLRGQPGLSSLMGGIRPDSDMC